MEEWKAADSLKSRYLLFFFLVITVAFLSADDGRVNSPAGGWLLFPGDAQFDNAFWDDAGNGMAPSFIFPYFAGEYGASGSDGGFEGIIGLSFNTPTLYFDTPFDDSSELRSSTDHTPAIPVLPEFQRAMTALPSLTSFELGAGFGGFSIYSAFDIKYRRDYFTGRQFSLTWPPEYWTTGLLGDTEYPYRSWLSWSSDYLGIALGRFPSGIIASTGSSVILNPQARYYDQLQLHLGNDTVRFMWMMGTSSNQLGKGEAEIQWRREDEGGTGDGTSYWDPRADHDYSKAGDSIKLYAYHLLEWRPIDSLRVGIAEMSVIGGAIPSLNMILPGLLWHNTYSSGHTNVGMAALFNYLPLPGFVISGQFFMDDITSPDESGTDDKPNAFAWLLSAAWRLELEKYGALTLGIEYSHVDRWTYTRWQPYLTMYQRNILPGGYGGIDTPLGHPYGPDCDQLGLSLSWQQPALFTAGLSLEYIRKGPIYMGMIVYNETDPGEFEAIPVYYDLNKYIPGELDRILALPDEHRFVLSANLDWAFSKSLKGKLRADLGYYKNYGHTEDDSRYSILIYLGAGWKIF